MTYWNVHRLQRVAEYAASKNRVIKDGGNGERMNRGIVFLVIVILGAVCVYLLLRFSKSRKIVNAGTRSLFGIYLLGNLYYTLLSRITISAAEFEAKLAAIFVGQFTSVPNALPSDLPTEAHQTAEAAEEAIETIALPMLDPTSPYYAMNTFVLNVLLYIPLGYLLPCVFPKLCRKTQTTILIGFLLSLATETTQLITNLGQFDVRDLICNTVGAAIGYVIYRLCLKRVCKL